MRPAGRWCWRGRGLSGQHMGAAAVVGAGGAGREHLRPDRGDRVRHCVVLLGGR